MFPYHHSQPLLNGNSHQNQASRQDSITHAASIENISDHSSIWRPVRLDQGPPTATESTHSLRSSVQTEYVRPVSGFERQASHGSVHPPLLEPTVTPREEKVPEEQKQGALWHPFWLRQAIFCVFSLLFLCCTIALPAMLLFSKRNNGLFEYQSRLVFLWRFGPTAVLTLLGIFWSRVEFQTLRYTPWMAIKSGQSLGQSGYSLDYTQMLSPAVLVQSLKRKHFFVFFVSTASMILKALIILSPGIFHSKITQSSRSVDVQVLDSFVAAEDLSNVTGTGPYYHARALQNFDMVFPFGVDKEGAYQTFALEDQSASARGSIDTPLTVTVDGVFSDMKCLELESYSVSSGPVTWLGLKNFTIDLQFENCEQTITIQNSLQWINPNKNTTEATWAVKPQPDNPCSSLPQQNPAFLYYAAHYKSSAQNVSLPQLNTCAAVICSPIAYTSKVRIIDDGVSPTMTVLPRQNKTAIKSNPWVMLQNSLPTVLGYVGISASLVSGPVEKALGFRGKDPKLNDLSLYQNKVLVQSIMNLTEQIGPMISHYQLRKTGTSQIVGSLVVDSNKLHVNEFVCLWMTGLFAVTTCISFWAIFRSRGVFHAWPRDPATILGSLLFFQGNTTLSTDVVNSVSWDRESKKTEWAHSDYAPPVLRAWFRATFILFVMGLIAGLIVALKASETSDGLGTIGEEGYLYLLWKSLPTLAMLLVAMYVAFNDTAIRDLATLSSLSQRPCESRELDMSLLDMLGFRALYHSIRLKIYAITISQILATLCAFLTTIAAALLSSQIIPGSTPTQFAQESWFGYRSLPRSGTFEEEYSGNREDIGSLLLARRLSNFTYPKNTYADLVFPILGIDDADWNTNTSARVRTPAAKLRPSCVELTDNGDLEVSHNLKLGDSNDTVVKLNFTQPFTCPDGSGFPETEFVDIKNVSIEDYGLSYFATLLRSPVNVEYISKFCHLGLDDDAILSTPWRTQTYVWGKISANLEFDHFSAWRCNYSWTEVTTDVNLIWASDTILIDHQEPPTQNSSSAMPWSPPFSFPEFGGTKAYLGLSDPYPEIEVTDPRASNFANQFSLLVEPFGEIQVEDFGKSSQDDVILEALHSNLGFIGAQLANLEYRLGIDEESAAAPTRHGDLAAVNATITNSGRLRLVQNATMTFVLVGILSSVVLVNTWALISMSLRHKLIHGGSWLLNMDSKGLAPRGFSSVAMMESLLHGSNFLKDVPPDTCPTSLSELHQWLAGTLFRIGWYQDSLTHEKEFTLGVLEDESFAFLGDKGDISLTLESTGEI